LRFWVVIATVMKMMRVAVDGSPIHFESPTKIPTLWSATLAPARWAGARNHRHFVGAAYGNSLLALWVRVS